MARYRNALPQLGGNLFLTDGGIETTLVFHEGVELPHFAAFHLMHDVEGKALLRKCYSAYADIAKAFKTGLILEAPTWRASADWGQRLGYTPRMLENANRQSVALLEGIRAAYEPEVTPLVISGCLGPREDAYRLGNKMSAQGARHYHSAQVQTFADTEADMLCAMTLNYIDEGTGIALAARDANMPLALSFTVETDGKLPEGPSLREAIEQVDQQTDGYPQYYMINCAHPSHFEAVLSDDAGPWLKRVRGIRANASSKSHAELDEATELDSGDPKALAAQYAGLKRHHDQLNIFGGCCGTDAHHVREIARACAPLFASAG
ncbi:MAG TPA: homocysteine S-methyltransferase family protein [Pseudomonas sp.]|uniref:homocysteine S-methyltransferase family protein n=1 Tax=Pseudomonas sp. TaxID=306 RepID=UPI002B484B98|nr:homocysteine S-methyltransferase family protein [Pseudomonas sp.]HKS11667.1 homocysteine S-methyltransferase family protein [Pseudomonas sp.]